MRRTPLFLAASCVRLLPALFWVRGGLWQFDCLSDAEGAGGQAGVGGCDLAPLLAITVVGGCDLPESVTLFDGVAVG
jgi:hypothetical protein